MISSFLSTILSLCYLGSCCIGRSKMSVVTSCPAFSEIRALLLAILLGTLQPSRFWGQVSQLQEMCVCSGCWSTPKGCILVTDFACKTEIESCCVAVLRLWAFSLCLWFLQHLSVMAAPESSAWFPEMLMHLSVSSFDCFCWLVLNPVSWWEGSWTR